MSRDFRRHESRRRATGFAAGTWIAASLAVLLGLAVAWFAWALDAVQLGPWYRLDDATATPTPSSGVLSSFLYLYAVAMPTLTIVACSVRRRGLAYLSAGLLAMPFLWSLSDVGLVGIEIVVVTTILSLLPAALMVQSGRAWTPPSRQIARVF